MVLVVDNYDSFTFNLVQYLGELGAEMQVRRNDVLDVESVLALAPSRIVISPGPGRPEHAGVTVELVSRLAGRVPILGVCLGHQAIGHAFGGKVIRATELMHGKTSFIHHGDSGVFSGLSNPFIATRYHSLIVEKESLPPCLRISAWIEDGTIMGLEHRERPLWGVQFHPESILTVEGKRLLQNFLELT
jgi:anthranilate synthase component 2